MTFREQLNEDLNVLMNAEEMADRVTVEGVEITCIFIDDRFAKVNKNFEDYSINKKIIFSEIDYAKINSPSFDSEILVENKVYRITNLKINFGTVELSLSGGDS